jgi:hypothetical protein
MENWKTSSTKDIPGKPGWTHESLSTSEALAGPPFSRNSVVVKYVQVED